MALERDEIASKPGEEDALLACELLERPEIVQLLAAIGHGTSAPDLPGAISGAGIEPSTVHRLLAAVIGPLGDVIVAVQPGFDYWCYPTAFIRGRLQSIDLTCTPYSPLAAWLVENPAVLVQLRIQNAIVSSRMDGLEIDFESAKELLLLGREPRNRPERIVTNSFALFGRTEEYANSPWSLEMLLEVFDHLSEGLDVPGAWLDEPLSTEATAAVFPYDTPRGVLNAHLALANGLTAGPGVHHVLVAIILERLVAVYRPFPVLNGTMARLMWHYYAERTGYPVLGVIPYASALNEAPSVPGPRSVIPTAGQSARPWRPDPDVTPLITHRLQVVEQALANVRFRVEKRKAQNEVLRILLEVDPSLNERQLTIIGRALRIPAATFRISYHRTSQGVAYSTARADFVELEEKGYLVRERKGHASIYRGAPNLSAMFGSPSVRSLEHTLQIVWDS